MSRLRASDDRHSKVENEDIGTGHRVSPQASTSFRSVGISLSENS